MTFSINPLFKFTGITGANQNETSKPMDLGWSLGTPYFANLSHVGFIRGLTKVRYIVSGHSHVGNEADVKFNDGHSVRVINLDSDYRAPTYRILDIIDL